MSRLVAALAALALLVPSAASAEDPVQRMEFEGTARTFALHVPAGAIPPEGFPVLFALHGGGGQAASMSRLTRFDALADRRRIIVVYPNGIDRHWNDGRATIRNKVDDVGFIAQVLDWLAEKYPVDLGRVFAAGISNGAMMSERLGCEMADRLRGIAAVAGTVPADIAQSCSPARGVAVLQIDGTDDPIMPYNGGKVADFGGRGEGGIVLSVQQTLDLWRRLNACPAPSPAADLQQRATPDGTFVTWTGAGPCKDGAAVGFYQIAGGGHAWPVGSQYLPAMIVGKASRQLDASAAILDFFLSLPPRP
jgi:polyhydroxybutyrate depolymerase